MSVLPDNVKRKKQAKKLNKKLIIAIALCVVVVLVAICLILFSWKKIVINDKDGNTIATAGELNIKKVRLKNSDYLSYVDVVIDEAKEILGEDYEPSGKMIINTNFDNDAFEACSTAYQSTEFAEDIPFAMSVVDINGAVICSYSKGPKEDKEFGESILSLFSLLLLLMLLLLLIDDFGE